MSDEVIVAPTRSEAINELATALAKAQGEMGAATKDSLNPHFGNKYADLASIWEACRAPLTKHGLCVLQPLSAEGARVTVTTILAHCSGQWISERLTMTAQQATPQAVGSAVTYGRRYALASMVGIAPDDDDGNAASRPVDLAKAPREKLNKIDPDTGELLEPKPKTITAKQQARLFTVAKKVGWSNDTIKTALKQKFQLDSTKDIPVEKYDDIVASFEEAPRPDADTPF